MDGLKSEMWLLAYEVTKKGWWRRSVSGSYIGSHPFFGELWKRDVQFYEPKRKSRPQVGKSFFAMVASLSEDAGPGEYPL